MFLYKSAKCCLPFFSALRFWGFSSKWGFLSSSFALGYRWSPKNVVYEAEFLKKNPNTKPKEITTNKRMKHHPPSKQTNKQAKTILHRMLHKNVLVGNRVLHPFWKLWKSTVLQLHKGTEGINFLNAHIFIWFLWKFGNGYAFELHGVSFC